MTATVLYGSLAASYWRRGAAMEVRRVFVAVTDDIARRCESGFSRLYLGAYYFSDILAAMIEGSVWLLFCISGVALVRWRAEAHRRRDREDDPTQNF